MAQITRADCVASVKAAGMSETDAREMVDMVLAERERLRALGQTDRMEKRLADFVSRKAEQAKITAAKQRQQAALNILRRQELDARLARFESETGGNTVEGILSMLYGSYKEAFDARGSVSRDRLAIARQWLGGAFAELQDRAHVFKLLRRDKDFLGDVVREMYEIKPEGRPGITGSDDARFVASIFSKYSEIARQRLNEAGAMIGKLDGWAPQEHDAAKMLEAGHEAWVERTMPLLDLERSFEGATPEEARAILGDVYENIVTGRGQAVSAAEKGQFLGPRNLARGMGKNRVLHFRNADAFLDYHASFGRGNVFTGVVNHLDRAARSAAAMERLGPNPENMLKSVVESAKRRIRQDATLAPEEKAARIAKLDRNISSRTGKIGIALSEVLGETLIPESVSAAKVASSVRAVQSLAKLGGAVLSSVADLMTYAMAARHDGMNLFEAYGKAFAALLEGRDTGEKRQIASMLGTMFDGVLGEISARWHAQDSMPGQMSSLMNTMFRASGLTYWTDALKAGYARMFSSHLADHTSRTWPELPEELRAMFRRHGWEEAQWEAVRSVEMHRAQDGRLYLLPESARRIPVDSLDGLLLRDRLTSLAQRYTGEEFERRANIARQDARKRLETDLMGIYADETMNAVIEPDDRTRALMLQGTKPGTLSGEVARFVMQFKSFPIAYMQRILGGQVYKRGGSPRDLAGVTHLIAGSLIFGYAAMVAKDFVKGKTPRDPQKMSTWIAAAAQSGGAGIYGDYLFGQASRFGNSPLESIAGPTAGTAANAISLWQKMRSGDARAGDAFYLALNNTPFINLWYTRAALDYAALFHVQEMMSPGTLSRRERRMKKEFGQKYLTLPIFGDITPSHVIRYGGGFR
ncbi:hypothetical protein dsx2_2649 [Desulfovibrio sp. X2]|uniref:hypothetical protein n=1 Tax=Desulfovibrio sp. X2 TaxID=941449 RepID=UPI000358E13F|nr:hypothetical protein [Desulfovibrio sp. X2]EPR42732.1 hypothetical protein dsx2_2649 [Desulfovibrio sp. X2]